MYFDPINFIFGAEFKKKDSLVTDGKERAPNKRRKSSLLREDEEKEKSDNLTFFLGEGGRGSIEINEIQFIAM